LAVINVDDTALFVSAAVRDEASSVIADAVDADREV